MNIQNSILAGEILWILHNSAGSMRIIDIEKIIQATKIEVHSAVLRLLSEELIDFIHEGEDKAIVLSKDMDMSGDNVSESLLHT